MRFALVLAIATIAHADIRFPDDAGYVDVTQPPYNAVPNSTNDCTAAIQKALSEARKVYLPAGTYLVSDIIHWGLKEGQAKRGFIQGAGRDRTIVKLADKTPGYDQPDRPKEVFRMASRDDLTGPANAFRNSIQDLTIDCGTGNPGAIGMLFYIHNQGSVERIRVKGDGLCGIDMYRGLTGPALLKDAIIEGFEYGIRAGGSVRQITLSEIKLKGQRRYGIYNDCNVLSMEEVTSANSVPAIHNRAAWGFISLVGGKLTGGDAKATAIENINGWLFVRDIEVAGYGNAITSKGQTIAGPRVAEFASAATVRLTPSADKSLRLPIEKTPIPAYEAPEQWVNVTKFGPPGNATFPDHNQRPRPIQDWSIPLQKAIDAGARTIYFPPETKDRQYCFASNVAITGRVERITFMDNQPLWKNNAVLRIGDGQAPVVIIERFQGDYGSTPDQWLIDTTRTVVFKNCIPGDILSTDKPGKVFLEDVCTGKFWMKGKQAFARQHNPEPRDTHTSIENGSLWVMGMKTEQPGLILQARNAKLEVLGGMVYENGSPKDTPMCDFTDSEVSLTLASCNHNGFDYKTVISETKAGQTVELAKDECWGRDGWGMALPLYRCGGEGKETYRPDTKTGAIIADVKILSDFKEGEKLPPPQRPADTKDREAVYAYRRAVRAYNGQFRRDYGTRFDIGRNLVEGEMLRTDRQLLITELPKFLVGADYLRYHVDMGKSKDLPADKPSVSFTITKDADVYLVLPDFQTVYPEGWERLPEKLGWIYSYNSPPKDTAWATITEKFSPLVKKRVKAGERVELKVWPTLVAAQPL